MRDIDVRVDRDFVREISAGDGGPHYPRHSETFMPAFSEVVSESVAKALVERSATNATQGST